MVVGGFFVFFYFMDRVRCEFFSKVKIIINFFEFGVGICYGVVFISMELDSGVFLRIVWKIYGICYGRLF